MVFPLMHPSEGANCRGSIVGLRYVPADVRETVCVWHLFLMFSPITSQSKSLQLCWEGHADRGADRLADDLWTNLPLWTPSAGAAKSQQPYFTVNWSVRDQRLSPGEGGRRCLCSFVSSLHTSLTQSQAELRAAPPPRALHTRLLQLQEGFRLPPPSQVCGTNASGWGDVNVMLLLAGSDVGRVR